MTYCLYYSPAHSTWAVSDGNTRSFGYLDISRTTQHSSLELEISNFLPQLSLHSSLHLLSKNSNHSHVHNSLNYSSEAYYAASPLRHFS